MIGNITWLVTSLFEDDEGVSQDTLDAIFEVLVGVIDGDILERQIKDNLKSANGRYYVDNPSECLNPYKER